jgi:hypothetical protein
LTEEALTQLWQDHPETVVVSPAGNSGTDHETYPAAFKGVIGVTALGPDRQKAPFGNHGAWVAACAPGVDVKSTFLLFDGEVAGVPVPEGAPAPTFDFQGTAYWSGTCFAAARVAGAIAETMARTGVNAPEAAFRLIGNGKPRLQDRGFDLGVPVYAPHWS